jgi:hypothetical protein
MTCTYFFDPCGLGQKNPVLARVCGKIRPGKPHEA